MELLSVAHDTAGGLATIPTYAFKSSVMGAGFEFRLEPMLLCAQAGKQPRAYDRIRAPPLVPPVTMQNYRFWPKSGQPMGQTARSRPHRGRAWSNKSALTPPTGRLSSNCAAASGLPAHSVV